MLKSMAKMKAIVMRYIPENAWGWNNGDVEASNIPNLFNLTDEEVSGFATTSCLPPLWVFRALAYRLGIKVPKADWFWYNHRICWNCERVVEVSSMCSFCGYIDKNLPYVKSETEEDDDNLRREQWADRY